MSRTGQSHILDAGESHVLDECPALIWRSDRNARCDYFNKAWLDFTGHSLEQELGNGWTQSLHPEDMQHCLQVYADAFRTRTAFAIEYRLRRRDGTFRWLRDVGRPYRDANGQFAGFIGTCFDITDCKNAQAQLQQSEERFRATFEQAAVGMAQIALDGRILRINERFCNILGYPCAQLLGRELHEITCAGEPAFDIPALVRGEVTSCSVEQRFLRSDGNPLWATLTLSMVNPAADERYLIAVLEDTDQCRRAEEQMLQHQAEIAHVCRVSTMGEIATGLAHELNQPLTAILNYARGASRRLAADRERNAPLLDALEQVATQAERAGEIIRRVREFVRKRDVRRTRVDLNAVVQGAARMASAKAAKSKVEVRLHLLPDLPAVQADFVQLEQVVLNLLLNAIEAMEGQAGRRELHARTSVNSGQEVLVQVTDVGTGLAPEHVEKIFEPFYTTKTEGMGMGLSIGRSIVEAHGGRLWTTPDGPHGATFSFTVPTRNERQ